MDQSKLHHSKLLLEFIVYVPGFLFFFFCLLERGDVQSKWIYCRGSAKGCSL